jgi:hypothetical protein
LATSFVIDGTRYYILFDDAMISMRYAYNLAHGNGLVWNIGERVQGFTNPLWVFYMAGLHLLPLPAAKVSLAVQITGTGLLTANLFMVRRVVEYLTGDLLAMLGAVALTAFYAPLNSYALLGMEVSALTLIITASVWMILRNSNGRFTPWLYSRWPSPLLRSDMAVAYVIILAAMSDPKRHRRRHLVWGRDFPAVPRRPGCCGSRVRPMCWYPI